MTERQRVVVWTLNKHTGVYEPATVMNDLTALLDMVPPIMERVKEAGALYGGRPYKIAGGVIFQLGEIALGKVRRAGTLLHEFFGQLDAMHPLLLEGLSQWVQDWCGISYLHHQAPLLRLDAHVRGDEVEILEVNTSAVDGFGIAQAIYEVKNFPVYKPVEGLKNFFQGPVTFLYSDVFRPIADEVVALRRYGLEGELRHVGEVPDTRYIFPYFKPIHLSGDEPIIDLYKRGIIEIYPSLRQSLDSKRNLILARRWNEELAVLIPETILQCPSAKERNQWIAKPAHGGSCRGILMGKSVSVRQWEQERTEPMVYQRFSEASTTDSLGKFTKEGITVWNEDGSKATVVGAKVKVSLFFASGILMGGFATTTPNRSLINDNGYNFSVDWGPPMNPYDEDAVRKWRSELPY